VDSNGNVLSTVGGGTTGSGDKLAGQYEQKTQDAIQAMLDKIVGPGNSTVAVSAKISNETAQRVTEQYTQPTNAPATSESTKKETYAGTGGTTAGVLGPDNIAVPNGGGGNGSYSSEDTTKNNAVDKVTETRDIPAGAVDRQTVSVAINSNAKGVNKTELQNLVESAAGFNQQRGDVVTVETVGFSSDAAKQAQAALAQEKEQQAQEQLSSYIRYGIIAAAIAAVVIIAIILIARRRKQAAEPIDIVELVSEDTLADPLAGILTTPTVPLPELVPATPIEPTSADQKRKEIAGMAARDPEKAAQLLRNLMDGKN
jgi:flagellar M-ring protein FliF